MHSHDKGREMEMGVHSATRFERFVSSDPASKRLFFAQGADGRSRVLPAKRTRMV